MSDIEEDFFARIRRTGIPLEDVIVIGSGALAAHGIRQARDVDLVVPETVFAGLEAEGSWKRGLQGSVSYSLIKDGAEVWTDWSTDGSGHPVYDDLLPNTELIGGIRFVTLKYLESRKSERGTIKDMEDIRKIHEYRDKK